MGALKRALMESRGPNWVMSLRQAIQERSESGLKAALDRGEDPSALDAQGLSGLHAAARRGFVEGAELLVSRCDPRELTQDEEGLDVLMLAAQSGSEPMARWALSAGGADPSRLSRKTRRSALMWAARAGSAEIVRLLAPLSDKESRDSEGRDALMSALIKPLTYNNCSFTDLAQWASAVKRTVKELLPYADPRARDARGLGALALAARLPDPVGSDALDELIGSGKWLDDDHQREIALIAAIEARSERAVARLVNQKACEAQDDMGLTPLMIAALDGESKIVKLLAPYSDPLRRAPVELKDPSAASGRSAAQIALRRGDGECLLSMSARFDYFAPASGVKGESSILTEALRWEREDRSDPNDESWDEDDGLAPFLDAGLESELPEDTSEEFIAALFAGRLEWAKRLSARANQAALDSNGASALMAAAYGAPSWFEELMERLADSRELVDSNGANALMWAARGGREAAARALLTEAGAKAVDKEGATALIYAVSSKMAVMEDLIRLSDIGAKDSDGRSAFLRSASERRLDWSEALATEAAMMERDSRGAGAVDVWFDKRLAWLGWEEFKSGFSKIAPKTGDWLLGAGARKARDLAVGYFKELEDSDDEVRAVFNAMIEAAELAHHTGAGSALAGEGKRL